MVCNVLYVANQLCNNTQKYPPKLSYRFNNKLSRYKMYRITITHFKVA